MNSNKKVLHARRDFNTKTSTITTALNSSLRSTSKLDLSFTRTLSSDSRKPPNLPRSAKNSRPPVPPLRSRNIPKQIPEDLRTREFDMFSYQEFRYLLLLEKLKLSSAGRSRQPVTLSCSTKSSKACQLGPPK
jgi:hypothetical protein